MPELTDPHVLLGRIIDAATDLTHSALRGIDQRASAATETPSVSGVVASNATRQSDSHQTPETDALWVALMDACKKSGVPPANADDTFALLDKFRSLEHRLRAAEAALSDQILTPPSIRRAIGAAHDLSGNE